MAYSKRRVAPKISPFLSRNCAKKAPSGAKCRKIITILNEIVQKKLKLTIKRKNREEIHQKQGIYLWITGMLTDYHYSSLTEFLPCSFASWIWGRFWPKYLPLCKAGWSTTNGQKMLLTVLGLLKGQSLSSAYATNLTVPEFVWTGDSCYQRKQVCKIICQSI